MLHLVRLHLPLHVDDRFCRCGARLDVFGHHRSACSRVGLLKPRGTPAEICVARMCQEAGARVKEYQLLRDLNIAVPVTDQGRIEVIANGLPFWGGKQLAVDTTVVSALTRVGVARGRWAGRAIHEAENDKRRRYHELVDGDRCHLLVMAFEVAGRWSREAVFPPITGSIQVTVGAERSASFHTAAVLPTLDSHAGVHHPTGIRSEPFAYGGLQLRERPWCVFGQFEPFSLSGSSFCSRGSAFLGTVCD